jgi:hypothetical protein
LNKELGTSSVAEPEPEPELQGAARSARRRKEPQGAARSRIIWLELEPEL